MQTRLVQEQARRHHGSREAGADAAGRPVSVSGRGEARLAAAHHGTGAGATFCCAAVENSGGVVAEKSAFLVQLLFERREVMR